MFVIRGEVVKKVCVYLTVWWCSFCCDVCLCRKVTRGHCPYHETGRCTHVKVGTEIFIQPPVLFTSPQIISGALRALPPLTYSVRTFAGGVRNRSLRLASNPYSRNSYRTRTGRFTVGEMLSDIILGIVFLDC